MKKLLVLLLLLLTPALGAGQDLVAKRNDNAALTLQATNGQLSKIAVDSKGRVFVNLSGSNITLGTVAIDQSTPGTTNKVYIGTNGTVAINSALPAGTNAIGKLAANSGVDIGDVDVTSVISGTGATSLGKAEDAGHSSGDVGVFALAVRNTAFATLTSNDLDYSPIAVNGIGAVRASLSTDTVQQTPVVAEDAAVASGDGLMLAGTVYRSSFSQSAGTSGDASTLNTDTDGRLAVNAFGSDTSALTSGCSSVATGTTDVAIHAAVASQHLYITAITCSNTDTSVSTQLSFDDGAQIVATGYINNTTLGHSSWTQNFNPPIRGTINTAFNVKPTTTSAEVTCCAILWSSVN